MVDKNIIYEYYVPDKGDLVWLNFSPQLGHEQAGRRPAIVLSYRLYNQTTGLAIFCPITSKIKGHPFEIKIKNSKIKGVALVDQIKSFDWKAREIEFIAKANNIEIDNILKLLKILLF